MLACAHLVRAHNVPGVMHKSCGTHRCAPSPLVGEGWGGGARKLGARRILRVRHTRLASYVSEGANIQHGRFTLRGPPPCPSPTQGGREPPINGPR
jgi:hypothetical protein